MLIALLIPLCLAILLFGTILVRSAIAKSAKPLPEAMAVGAIVNFFDTLGIGSFATTTAWLKFRRLVPDRLLPQTMLVGLTPPSMRDILACIREHGRRYVAEVLEVDGALCRVEIRPDG